MGMALRPNLTLELLSMPLALILMAQITWDHPQVESLSLNLCGIQLMPAECHS